MIKIMMKFLPALALIAISIVLSGYWLSHQPRAERAEPKISVPLVEIIEPEIISHQTTISAMGNVIAAQSVNLTPRISGMVKWISPNFIEGGVLKKR